jgi:hypothetical protein
MPFLSRSDHRKWTRFNDGLIGRLARICASIVEDGAFAFTAPWSEAIFARPGDSIVQDIQTRRTLTGRGKALSLTLMKMLAAPQTR